MRHRFSLIPQKTRRLIYLYIRLGLHQWHSFFFFNSLLSLNNLDVADILRAIQAVGKHLAFIIIIIATPVESVP